MVKEHIDTSLNSPTPATQQAELQEAVDRVFREKSEYFNPDTRAADITFVKSCIRERASKQRQRIKTRHKRLLLQAKKSTTLRKIQVTVKKSSSSVASGVGSSERIRRRSSLDRGGSVASVHRSGSVGGGKDAARVVRFRSKDRPRSGGEEDKGEEEEVDRNDRKRKREEVEPNLGTNKRGKGPEEDADGAGSGSGSDEEDEEDDEGSPGFQMVLRPRRQVVDYRDISKRQRDMVIVKRESPSAASIASIGRFSSIDQNRDGLSKERPEQRPHREHRVPVIYARSRDRSGYESTGGAGGVASVESTFATPTSPYRGDPRRTTPFIVFQQKSTGITAKTVSSSSPSRNPPKVIYDKKTRPGHSHMTMGSPASVQSNIHTPSRVQPWGIEPVYVPSHGKPSSSTTRPNVPTSTPISISASNSSSSSFNPLSISSTAPTSSSATPSSISNVFSTTSTSTSDIQDELYLFLRYRCTRPLTHLYRHLRAHGHDMGSIRAMAEWGLNVIQQLLEPLAKAVMRGQGSSNMNSGVLGSSSRQRGMVSGGGNAKVEAMAGSIQEDDDVVCIPNPNQVRVKPADWDLLAGFIYELGHGMKANV
ncbi:hypothetical protein BDN72DRAFT_845626 [Pluteus cervinus]|uniref:Uncharacterized protein n=1 Tax=Pluteus cervinus TaxID=181527 RepID=A0ACD3AJ61_9AGAR|nr:hypothetical protein BDN72DRAFT_845626 [Pluteus cervinus]